MAKMMSEIATMRPKMAKMRPKMAKMMQIMAKMRHKRPKLRPKMANKEHKVAQMRAKTLKPLKPMCFSRFYKGQSPYEHAPSVILCSFSSCVFEGLPRKTATPPMRFDDFRTLVLNPSLKIKDLGDKT